MENNAPQLKPCPFCGKKAEIRNKGSGSTKGGQINEFIRYFYIWCPNCGCTQNNDFAVMFDYSPITGPRADESNLQKAIEIWNRRAENGNV